MLAAATYPVLFVAFAAGRSPRATFSLQATGWGLALVVAVSRLMVGAHTPSEVVAGFVLGGAASAIALAKADWLPLSVHPVALIALLVWFSTGAVDMPPSQTHSRITQLALAMSGNKAPFERKEILLPRLVINPL
jgi:hypothetical protein